MKIENLYEANRLADLQDKISKFKQNIPDGYDSLTITIRKGYDRGKSSSISIPLDLQVIDVSI